MADAEASGSDWLLLLTLGLEEVQVSAAIGAFLVGLALSGSVQARAAAVVGPLRDLFAATFFLFFSFSVDPSDLVGVLAPAALLAAFGIAGKLVSGWVAARPLAAGVPGRLRAGTVLIARGEFSIVTAARGATTADGAELGAMVRGQRPPHRHGRPHRRQVRRSPGCCRVPPRFARSWPLVEMTEVERVGHPPSRPARSDGAGFSAVFLVA